ncbi:MAG TPA: cupin domain-containing protein [bacterium (Candidatus Stahlbacteria)]|nr:cupin domain-containing protein [Candidatus Stahlbacteria bacterium]
MKVSHYRDIRKESPDMKGAKGVMMRWLVSRDDGAKKFVMRMFEIEEGGYTPLHMHNFEHEVFVVNGRGVLVSEGGREQRFERGYVLFVPPNQLHQFRNTGEDILRFICVVPA